MNMKELQQRGKGLMALMLALIMMFGTSMTVLAATYNVGETALTTGQKLNGGDVLKKDTGSGSIWVYIDDVGEDCGLEYTLPEGKSYKVISFQRNGYNYDVKLKTIRSTANPKEAPWTEDGNGGGQPHIHSYSWVTTREATETQDGLDEYKCACGAVDAQAVIPASQMLVKGFCKAVREAAPNSRVAYDMKNLCTMSDKMIACLAERSDATVEITFIYQKTPYRMTIPAGSDYSALLADEDMFYGYFYFADQIGAQIEPVS